MSKIKYLLFFIPFLFFTNVFATDYDVSDVVKYSMSGASGTYGGEEIYLGGQSAPWSINTRYNGRLSTVDMYIGTSNFDMSSNTTYTVILNMATEDWRNRFMTPNVYFYNSQGNIPTTSNKNLYVSNSFQFVSYKKVKFNFKTGSTSYPYIRITLYSTNYSSVAITGDNNWNLKSVIISNNQNSGGSSGGSSGGGSSGSTFDDTGIINNANSNTQSIIDNDTTNTSNIIENNNQNSENIINSIDSNSGQCKNSTTMASEWFITDEGSLSNTGATSGVGNGVSKYLVIKPSTSYTIDWGFSSSTNNVYFCFYTGRKQVSECYSEASVSKKTITSPIDAQYLRITFNRRNGSLYPITITGPVCNDWQSEGFTDIGNSIDSVGQSLVDGANNIIDSVNDSAGTIGDAVIDGANSIIDSLDDNMQEQILNDKKESLKQVNSERNNTISSTCSNAITFDFDYGKVINSSGQDISNNADSYYTKDYISTSGINRLCFNKPDNSVSNYYIVQYDNNKNVITYVPTATRCINLNENTKYIRFASPTSSTTLFKDSQCINRQDTTNSKLDDLNDTMTDETQPTIDIDLDLSSDTPISDLLLMPIHLIQKVYDNANNTCQPYTIPFDFSGGDNTLTFPCFNLSNYVGNDVANIIDKLLAAVMAYEIGLMCVSIFNDFTSLRDDFSGIYSPRHDYGSYRGKHSGNWDGGND